MFVLPAVRPFVDGAGYKRLRHPDRLLWPLLTSRSAASSFPSASPFQAQGEISPGKNSDLPRTTAGSTWLRLGRESFAFRWTLALLGHASYPVSVRRLDGFATPLLSALPSRSAPCGSLGSLRPTSQRTFTSQSMFMLGTQTKRPRRMVASGPFLGGAGDGLLSRVLSDGVPSALSGLTTVFGMGTGVALTL